MARSAVVVVAAAAAAMEEQRDAEGKGAVPIPGARRPTVVEEQKQPGLVLERPVQQPEGAVAREIPILPRVDWRKSVRAQRDEW